MFGCRNGRNTWLDKGKVTMLFYDVLIVASLVTAGSIPLLYFLFKGAGTVICETVDLSRDSDFPREAKTIPIPTNPALLYF